MTEQELNSKDFDNKLVDLINQFTPKVPLAMVIGLLTYLMGVVSLFGYGRMLTAVLRSDGRRG